MSAKEDFESDPFPQPLREPTVLDQVARQCRENDRLSREIEHRVRERLSSRPPAPPKK
jgi:hypothetical protein